MHDLPRQKLTELVAKHGQEICADPKCLEGLLKDVLRNEHKREVFVLVNALREGVVEEFGKSARGMPVSAIMSKLVRQLCNNMALDESAARWGIESWAAALRVIPIRAKSRLPMYFLIDCSSIQTSDSINAMQHALAASLAELRVFQNELVVNARVPTFVSVITFGSSACQIIPLTDIMSLPEVTLQPDTTPGVDLAGALWCLIESLHREINFGGEDFRKYVLDRPAVPVILIRNRSTSPQTWVETAILRSLSYWVTAPTILNFGPGSDVMALRQIGGVIGDGASAPWERVIISQAMASLTHSRAVPPGYFTEPESNI